MQFDDRSFGSSQIRLRVLTTAPYKLHKCLEVPGNVDDSGVQRIRPRLELLLPHFRQERYPFHAVLITRGPAEHGSPRRTAAGRRHFWHTDNDYTRRSPVQLGVSLHGRRWALSFPVGTRPTAHHYHPHYRSSRPTTSSGAKKGDRGSPLRRSCSRLPFLQCRLTWRCWVPRPLRPNLRQRPGRLLAEPIPCGRRLRLPGVVAIATPLDATPWDAWRTDLRGLFGTTAYCEAVPARLTNLNTKYVSPQSQSVEMLPLCFAALSSSGVSKELSCLETLSLCAGAGAALCRWRR